MPRYRGVAFLGVALGAALGVALAAGPVAVADAIDDAWPYGGFGPTIAQVFPGGAGQSTNAEDTNLGLIDFTQFDRTFLNSSPSVGTWDWYTEHFNGFNIALLGGYSHEVVQSVLDASAGYPHVGTTLDSLSLLPYYLPLVGPAALFNSYTLTDPELGFANTSGFVFVTNTFVSDAAGIKDFVTFFGQTSTLFDIPFTAPEAGGTAASDVGDGLTSLATLFDSGALP